jgi:hypothetical protein
LLALGFEDKKVSKKASDGNDDAAHDTFEGQHGRKKQKIEHNNNDEDYEQGRSDDDNMQSYDDSSSPDGKSNHKDRKGQNSQACSGIASV